MINFVRGNMFDDLAGATYIVNLINCNGVMGKGVALEFKKRYPLMFGWYRQLCHDKRIRPGDVVDYPEGDLTILNMATKSNWWEPSQYEWVEAALDNLHLYLLDKTGILLLPPPGCGNGGLQWGLVKPMIKRHLKDLECEVRVYEPV